jgi:hypothetical protein
MATHHDDASCEVAELLVAQKAPYRAGHGIDVVVLRTDDGDARVAARRVSTDIAKASIERDDKALLPRRCGEDIGVTGARETFVDHGVDVVAQGGGNKPRRLWEILV